MNKKIISKNILTKRKGKKMGIKFYGKSQEVANSIVDQFESGNLPQALAQIFVNRNDNIPSSSWSWRNQFLVAVQGSTDARGFNQWKEAGRKVSKGSKAFHILAPCFGKKTEQDENGKDVEHKFLYGFKSIPVFALESTEIIDAEKWEECGGVDQKEENRLADLPLRDVAEKWGLSVQSYNGKNSASLGSYIHGSAITVGVENLSTWAHELVHAADDKLGKIKKINGQDPGNEIVAELGGAVILKIMGFETEADVGGAWDYIKSYSKNDDSKALSLCGKLIDRVCACVDLIIDTASNVDEIKEAA